MRQLPNWRRDGNERYEYWPTGLLVGITYYQMVANLITYDEENAHLLWKESLEQAVLRMNQQVRGAGFRFRVRSCHGSPALARPGRP